MQAKLSGKNQTSVKCMYEENVSNIIRKMNEPFNSEDEEEGRDDDNGNISSFILFFIRYWVS